MSSFDSLDYCIVATRATRIEDNRIHLKLLAIAGGNGPGFDMEESQARSIIECLQKVLDGAEVHQIG